MSSEGDLYSQAALGFRYWRFYEGLGLLPLINSSPWSCGDNFAECRNPHAAPHSSPQASCKCGLYAYHNFSHAQRSAQRDRAVSSASMYIVGAVAARGRLQLHWSGWRAERARMIALLAEQLPEPHSEQLIEGLCKRYQVPVYTDRTEFLDYVKQQNWVASVPQSARPGPPLVQEQIDVLRSDFAAAIKDEQARIDLAERISVSLDSLYELAELYLYGADEERL